MTLAFLRLGKIAPWDAFFYVLAQFAGGILGVRIAAGGLRSWLAAPSVNYAVTVPGPLGAGVALAAELVIAFLMMTMVLAVSNTPRLASFTPFCAGALVATYISVEAPLSGMSMNPARTFGSALSAHLWTSLWIYFVAPPLAMQLAAAVYLKAHGAQRVCCAKLDHQTAKRCIFRCGYQQNFK